MNPDELRDHMRAMAQRIVAEHEGHTSPRSQMLETPEYVELARLVLRHIRKPTEAEKVDKP